MHAIILGLIGALLGVAIGRSALPPAMRKTLVVIAGAAGAVAILILNTVIAERILPELSGNPSLGVGIFLLSLWHLERTAAARAEAQRSRRSPL